MNWISVRQFPLQDDLSDLARALRARRIPHRFTEERQSQWLQVPDARMAEPVAQFVDAWLAGQVSAIEPAETVPVGPNMNFWQTLRLCPVILLLIALSALGFAVMNFAPLSSWAAHLTFVPVQVQFGQLQFGSLADTLSGGQYWRLITPAFLHFSILHIAFNGLWCWELGRRIEWLIGPFKMAGFFLVSAAISNLAQYVWPSQASLFGGLSGVVYAMVGFIGVHQYFRPNSLLAVPKGVLVFMLVWLVICLLGVVDLFMSGGVANGAHLGGLVAGAGFALLVLWLAPATRDSHYE